VQDAAPRFSVLRDALETNPGVIAFGDGWVGQGVLRNRGVFRDPFSQGIIPYEWRGVALLMVEGFIAREKNQDIRVTIYSHLAATQPLPLQSLFTDERIANAAKFVDVIYFLQGETKIYRITVYIARDYSIFSDIFFL